MPQSLRGQLILFSMACCLAITAIGTFLSHDFLDDLVTRFGKQSIEDQVLLQKTRALQPITQDAILAQMMAANPSVRAWLREPDNPTLKREAFDHLESNRAFFRDDIYFLVNHATGRYYFSDGQAGTMDDAFAYTMQASKPEDAWYFETIRSGDLFTLNVNTDLNLQTTRVWINIVVRDGEAVLGMLGTGIDLSAFIQDVVNNGANGAVNVLIARDGAIQAHPDTTLIDFASVTKRQEEKSTIFELLPNDAEREALEEALAGLGDVPDRVDLMNLTVQDRNYLAGLSSIEGLGWHIMVLFDPSSYLPVANVLPILIILSIAVAVMLIATVFLMDSFVFKRILRLDHSTRRLVAGHYDRVEEDGRDDEIGRLNRAFNMMVNVIRKQVTELEETVAARTADLEQANQKLRHLSDTDALTGLANRRKLDTYLIEECAAARRLGVSIVVALVDVDYFKQYNDIFGHQRGDDCLKTIATTLGQSSKRATDLVARYGGEEFTIVLTGMTDMQAAEHLEQVRRSIESLAIPNPGSPFGRITVSIGFASRHPGDMHGAAQLLEIADTALYRAKGAGRNQAQWAETSDLSAELA